MKAVGDLYGVRRRPSCGFRILTTTIPAYYLHRRVLVEPADEGVRAPVGQDVNQRVTFEIHQDRPVAGSPAECEVVHAQDPRRLAIRKRHRADVVQQSVSGDHDSEVPQEA